jgi:hypothetical protein
MCATEEKQSQDRLQVLCCKHSADHEPVSKFKGKGWLPMPSLDACERMLCRAQDPGRNMCPVETGMLTQQGKQIKPAKTPPA